MPSDIVTDTELKLARIWAELLDLDAVDRGDDFFRIGGDSMLATKFVLQARRIWEVEVTVRALLDAPVLRDMAAQIDLLVAAA